MYLNRKSPSSNLLKGFMVFFQEVNAFVFLFSNIFLTAPKPKFSFFNYPIIHRLFIYYFSETKIVVDVYSFNPTENSTWHMILTNT